MSSAPVTGLQVVVVDDEQLAREELCFQLQRFDGIEVVGQAANGVDALKTIEEHEPDLVFLDVQMPGLNGFEVARNLVARGLGAQLVFVTAYDQYAVEAFNVSAVDYLLKPVEPGRLEQAIEKVRRRVAADRPRNLPPLGTDELERLLRLLSERDGRREQVALKVGERFLLIQAEEIVHASLVDDAITVVTNTVSGTSNYRSLDELQTRLDPAVFWRVHRSHLVNIHKIKEIVPWFSRNYILKMKDAKATEIPVSRSQTRRLREYLRL
ncbi:MAG TPA: LytTR family DNA-binding domain-containing protein [Vicinamibacterales bacterium]|nr:LytTR family DNA-binding domain-containing protein [Vicinamibacterales bacterium]